jgi:hypothetical protein
VSRKGGACTAEPPNVYFRRRSGAARRPVPYATLQAWTRRAERTGRARCCCSGRPADALERVPVDPLAQDSTKSMKVTAALDPRSSARAASFVASRAACSELAVTCRNAFLEAARVDRGTSMQKPQPPSRREAVPLGQLHSAGQLGDHAPLPRDHAHPALDRGRDSAPPVPDAENAGEVIAERNARIGRDCTGLTDFPDGNRARRRLQPEFERSVAF